MAHLVPLFQRAGVTAMFSGHEHNFQHSIADGIHYFVTGAAGRARNGTPDRFAEAQTVSWSTDCHFLLANIDGDLMTVRAVGEQTGASRSLTDIVRRDPAGEVVTHPMEIRRP
jgi:hypothetical protein